MVFDAKSNEVSKQSNKAWVKVCLAGSLPTGYQYTGQYLDSYIKLILMVSRWLDPELGRFTQADSIVEESLGKDYVATQNLHELFQSTREEQIIPETAYLTNLSHQSIADLIRIDYNHQGN
jgi:RHS repeat-associated protein